MCGGHRRLCERLWTFLLSSLWEKKSDTDIKSWPGWSSNRVPLDPKSQSFQLSHEALDVFSWLKTLFVFGFFFYMNPWTIYKNVLHLIPQGNAREDSAKRASTRENMAARAQLFYRYDTYRRVSHNVVTMETNAIGWPLWLITFWYSEFEEIMSIPNSCAYSCSKIYRYQYVINQGGHPFALVSMVTTLWERVYTRGFYRYDTVTRELFSSVYHQNWKPRRIICMFSKTR